MLTNKDIKHRQLFKLNQQQIKILGELKQAQNDMIVSINDCALVELDNENVLKRGVIAQKMKFAVKRYTKMYMEYVVLQRDIETLKQWKAQD